MGKGNRRDREYDLNDKLKFENDKLKRELKTIRKQLERYINAEEKGLIENGMIVPSQKRKNEEQQEQILANRWLCHDCGIGTLKLVIFGNRYMRCCDNCGKHTKSQPLHNKIEEVE